MSIELIMNSDKFKNMSKSIRISDYSHKLLKFYSAHSGENIGDITNNAIIEYIKINHLETYNIFVNDVKNNSKSNVK